MRTTELVDEVTPQDELVFDDISYEWEWQEHALQN